MERGEVYYLRYDDGYGREQAVGRPVVIVSSQKGIDTSDVVTVVFLSSRYKQVNINVEVHSLPRRSWVLCNQLSTVDKRRLQDRLSKLTKDEMEEVDERICEALGMESIVKVERVLEPVVVDDGEKIRLQIELDLYKKLYTDVVKYITDARFDRQPTVSEVETPVETIGETVELKVVEEEIVPDIVIDGLAEKMFTPNCEMVEEKPKKALIVPKKKNKKVVEKVVEKANINKDSWETIHEITGMSKQTAQEIVKWREKHGDFIDLDDLLFVRRFGSTCMKKYGPMLEA